jgi:hypothetical protein
VLNGLAARATLPGRRCDFSDLDSNELALTQGFLAGEVTHRFCEELRRQQLQTVLLAT